MAKMTNAERCREHRRWKKAERAGAEKVRAATVGAEVDTKEARRVQARQRYARLKAEGGPAYRKILAAAKIRAAAYHARVRALAKKSARGKAARRA